MIRLRIALFALLCSMPAAPSDALAEWRESVVGLMGGAVFPSFQPPDQIAPVLVGWMAGAEALYGVTDNLSLRGAFAVSKFAGRLDGWTVPGSSYSGAYTFDAAYYHPEIGVRYKVYGGYNLAPYIEANAGYMWMVYANGVVRRRDASTVAYVGDKARGHISAGAGFALDYRLADTAFIGAAVRYTRAFGELATGMVSVPLYASYYW